VALSADSTNRSKLRRYECRFAQQEMMRRRYADYIDTLQQDRKGASPSM